MFITFRLKRVLAASMALILTATVCITAGIYFRTTPATPDVSAAQAQKDPSKQDDFIKWVNFDIPYSALEKAMEMDISSREKGIKLNWIELLAYGATVNYGNWKTYKPKQLDDVALRLAQGKKMVDITKDMEYYSYYLECYNAVLAEFVGQYNIEVKDESAPDGKRWEQRYGLKLFSPIAKGYYFTHYEDFGNSRTYGYNRKHLGNDLMGQVGTPIVAVEGGTVEALGWNMYGGWRIGIRSFDKKRYYYYAHLRKDFPYKLTLKEGDTVQAGDVIGYLGRSGYSPTENTNNITTPHLHFGMQLIFDESQKEGPTEIWIDVYNLIELLQKNKVECVKDPQTKDYSRVYNYDDGRKAVQQ